MKVHIKQGLAWVLLPGEGSLICIGAKKEVAYRSEPELGHMVIKALALAQYNVLEQNEVAVH